MTIKEMENLRDKMQAIHRETGKMYRYLTNKIRSQKYLEKSAEIYERTKLLRKPQ